MKVVIFGLDGTLSLNEHRKHYVKIPPMNVWLDMAIKDIKGIAGSLTYKQQTIAAGLAAEYRDKWKADWEAFYESCDEDLLNKPVAALYDAIRYTQDYEMAIFTGRSESVISKTDKWLIDHNLYYDHLYMRPLGDIRKEEVVKKEMLNNFLQEFNLDLSDIAFVVEDKKQVADMWRALGLTCLQCAEGNL